MLHLDLIVPIKKTERENMHQIKLAEIYFRIVCLCIFAALPVLLLFSLCFLEASVSISACMLLKIMEEDKDEKEAKLERLAGDFAGVAPFNCLSVASHSGFLH